MAKLIKHIALNYIKNHQPVSYRDLERDFQLSGSGARSYLYYLIKQNLIRKDENKQYWLTEEGEKRLEWFKSSGCANESCSSCTCKSSVQCRHCGNKFPPEELKISPERDQIFGYLPEGVYCPNCDRLILSKEKAEELQIKKEE